jgi:hypothetical protein
MWISQSVIVVADRQPRRVVPYRSLLPGFDAVMFKRFRDSGAR